MPTGTVRLHRVLRAPAERVYRAFLDADAMAKWLPPHGFTCQVQHLEARVGGTFRMSFTNFSSGNSHAFGGEYLELVPHERIRYTDRFDDPNLPGVIEVTVVLTPGVLRHRDQHRAERPARSHSGRDVLSGLARVAGATGRAGRADNPGLMTPNFKLQNITVRS